MRAVIRAEEEGDAPAIRDLLTAAFAGSAEARLVDLLQAGGYVLVSLVAADPDDASGRIVGHILFSRMQIDTSSGPRSAVALAPMAVLPGYQGKGIGSALVGAGLEACRRNGETIVIVLGHPGYYPRFGFSSELARQLSGPYSGDAFMALELQTGAMRGVTGSVRYAPPFREFE